TRGFTSASCDRRSLIASRASDTVLSRTETGPMSGIATWPLPLTVYSPENWGSLKTVTRTLSPLPSVYSGAAVSSSGGRPLPAPQPVTTRNTRSTSMLHGFCRVILDTPPRLAPLDRNEGEVVDVSIAASGQG